MNHVSILISLKKQKEPCKHLSKPEESNHVSIWINMKNQKQPCEHLDKPEEVEPCEYLDKHGNGITM